MLLTERNFRIAFGTSFILLIATVLLLSASAHAQTANQTQIAKSPVQETEKLTVLKPAVTEIKGIAIGMTADEVKDKLGKAKTADKSGLYYVFSDEHSMQIALDADEKVQMIAAFYVGKDAEAPKFEDVLGAGTTIEKQADGKIYKLVDYPEAGYWIAYNSVTVQDKPMVTITMQKMP